MPNLLETANYCSFNLNVNGRFIKNINFLLNYSYKKWCHLNIGAEATKTAKTVDNSCEINTVKLLTNLERIGHQISDISALSGLINLTNLNLKTNLIVNLPRNIFANLKELKTLVLWQNQISNLDKDIFKYNTKMTSLDLDDNKFTSLPKGIFDSLVNLTNLDLRRNPQLVFDHSDLKIKNSKLNITR